MNQGFEDPPAECPLCPRLVEYRHSLRTTHPGYFNSPVPSFGPIDCRLLIVGLAPGKSGANQTGRPFTGDYAGDLLYATLLKFGLAAGVYGARRNDGLALNGTRISNAVRCVPPGNRPEPAEIKTCRGYLRDELRVMRELRVILVLGRVAHEQVLAALALRQSAYPFGHGRHHQLPTGARLIDSYHCSRYNTNTGRLTTDMFESLMRSVVVALA